MSIRLRDIADHLGISVSTVSLALRAAPQIAEETRERVRDAAEQLGYIQRPRQIPYTKLRQVAFITASEIGNIFYGAVLSGAEQECHRAKIALHYSLLHDQRTLDPEQYSRADGLLVVGSVEEMLVRQICELGRPTVLVDNNLSYVGIDRVLIENFSSLYRSVCYLYQRRHRKIAFLNGPGVPSFRERLLGYRTAIAELDLEPIELHTPEIANTTIEQIITGWLNIYDRTAFTALIACSDRAAVAALHALQDHGVRVPEDVSLIGFDDIELASLMRPTLTTNHVHRELLGRLGVQQLIRRAQKPELPALALSIATDFIERESTRSLD